METLRSTICLLAATALMSTANAEPLDFAEFEVGELIYSVLDEDEMTVEVYGPAEETPLSENLVIPGEVTYDGHTFKVVSVSYFSFYENDVIKSLVLSEGIESIRESAFYECFLLKSVTIPSTLTVIENEAFTYCQNIEEYIVSENNPVFTSYNNGLYNKDMSEVVMLPTANTTFSLPESVNKICQWSCSYNPNITEITIPSNITEMELGSFYGNQRLTKVTINANVTELPEWGFAFNKRLESVIFPESLTKVGVKTFELCQSLKEVSLPEAVETIEEGAFRECSALEIIRMGSAVNSIGESAFGTCLKVNEIHIAATVPPTACSNSFSPAICPSAIIYVPVGSKEAYASADVWKGFSNIREESTSGISEAISVPFKANVEQGSLTISNADGMQVQVYTLDGRMIYSTDSYTGEHISISGGPHIIKVEDSTITVL